MFFFHMSSIPIRALVEIASKKITRNSKLSSLSNWILFIKEKPVKSRGKKERKKERKKNGKM